MQIICISRGTLSGGRQLAEKLAQNLGYECLSREELIEDAVKEGILVGKLETAMIKPSLFSERLALEREYYIAFTTARLCERAREGKLVYHGRTGHLLLPGVGHVLRVRVVADREFRVKAAMQQLGLDRERARRYVDEVDEDRRRWVHNLYGVSMDDAAQYDVVMNLEQLSVGNAASALTAMAQLPDFQMTPASRKAMENLYLGAQARLALARHESTHRAGFKVRADSGVVTVTYNPQNAGMAASLAAALKDVAGIREIRATMATTNILWIQEQFDAQAPIFKEVVEIATKWNAAVELVRFESAENGEETEKPEPGKAAAGVAAAPASAREYNGGIEDDVTEAVEGDDQGMNGVLDELAKLGRSGGGKQAFGTHEHLLASLDRSIPYTLVVVGDVFLSKGHAARTRLSRELQSFLADHVRAPVVATDDLKTQYLFSKRDAVQGIGFLLITALLYFVVFTHQLPVLNFLIGTEWKSKSVAAAVIFLIVPLVAYLYGNVAKLFLKLIKME
jgi:cytidylate kinase